MSRIATTATVDIGPIARRPRLVMALVGFALAILYAPVLYDLVVAWSETSYYTYGFLIPPFSAWLLWDARHRLARASYVGWRPGLGIAAVGLLLATLGTAPLEDSLVLRALSLPIVLTGLGLFAWGRDGFRPFAFPIGFLALMTPLPDSVTAALSLPLQDLAARFTTAALNVIGIPATRSDLYVRLPSITLYVEEWCNGLRFMLAMFVVGIAFGSLTLRTTLRRALAVVMALGVGLVGNLIRVAGTGVIAHEFGRAAASGMMHLVYGKIVYLTMMVPFVLAVLWLRRTEPPAASTDAR
jgi:exosortase